MANDQLIKSYIAAIENNQDFAPSAKQIPYGDMVVVHNFKTNAFSLVKVGQDGIVIGESYPLNQENPFMTNPENGRIVCYNICKKTGDKEENYLLDSQGNKISNEQALYLQKITGAKTIFSEIAKLQSFEMGDAVNEKQDIADALANMGELTPKTIEEYIALGNFVQALLTSGALHTPPTSDTVSVVLKNLTKIKTQVESVVSAERAKQEKLNDSLTALDSFLHGADDNN